MPAAPEADRSDRPGLSEEHKPNDILRRELDAQCRPKRAEAERTQVLVEVAHPWRQGKRLNARCFELATAEFATLRLRLLKIAARVVETTSRIRLAFAAACPEADLFRSLPGALLPLGP